MAGPSPAWSKAAPATFHSPSFVTFGLGRRDRISRVVIQSPNGKTEDYKNLAAGQTYHCVEAKNITALNHF